MHSDFLLMSGFALFVSLVFAVIAKDDPREQVRFGGMMFAGFLAVAVVFGPAMIDRFAGYGDGGRPTYWATAIRMFQDAPLLGQGPGTWMVRRMAFTEPGEFDYYQPHAHDQYLQTAAELGIVGLMAFAKIDAHYLHVEKAYRDLHDAVIVENNVVPLSMDTANLPARSRNESYASWSIKWFYAPLILAGVLLLIYSFVHPRGPEPHTNITVNVPSQVPSTTSNSTPPALPQPPPPSPPAVTPSISSTNAPGSPTVPDAHG